MNRSPGPRRLAIGVVGAVALSLGLASGLRAQAPHPPASGAPDVSPGPASITGRLIHRERPEAAGDLEVILYALTESGTPGLRTTRTDAAGAFGFANIEGDPGTVYLVGARYRDIPFGERVVFAVGEREQSVELAISEPSSDASRLDVGELSIRVDHGCGQLRVSESIEVRNAGASVLYVPEALRGSLAPLLEFPLPQGASDFRLPLGAPAGLRVEDRVIQFWGPIHPGGHDVEFFYALDSGAGALRVERLLTRGAERVEVTTPAYWAAPRGAAFTAVDPGPRAAAGPSDVRRSALPSLAPGSQLAFSLPIAPAAATRSAVEVVETQIWLEMDDAAVSVNEHHVLSVPAESAGTSASGAPLLCIPLARGAEALRFSPESLAMGLVPDPSGALAVQGPLKAGPGELHFRYRLPVTSESLRFERRFDNLLPLLTLFVADTSVNVSTDRLHRRRATRSGERSYLHFEAFGIEKDEEIVVTLAPITPAAALPPWVTGGLVAAAATGTLAFLAAPLYLARERPEEDFNPAIEAAAERESVYAAIDDADHDFETGKLDAEEHERLRIQLRARAVSLLRTQRASVSARAAPAPEAAADPTAGDADAASFCHQCGAELAAQARFCSRCGVRLADGAAPG